MFRVVLVLMAVLGFAFAAAAQDVVQDQTMTQSQGQTQASDVNVIANSNAHDSRVTASAAPVFAGNCAQGVSGQAFSFGASVASGNPVCDFVAVAGGRAAIGDAVGAAVALDEAFNAAKRRATFATIRSFITLGLL